MLPEEDYYLLDDGTPLDEAMSVYQKAIRRGEEELAIYYGFQLYQRFPGVFWRRTLTIASEDIGNADPQAAILTHALRESCEWTKKQSKGATGNVYAMQAIFYLLRAPKNRETDNVLPYLRIMIKNGYRPEIPDWALDKHTKRGRQMGRGGRHFFTEGAELKNEQGIDNYKGKFDPDQA